MKLSNKILIGFFGFLFLYLTAVFAEIRLSGTPYIVDDSNSVGETVETGTVNFVVLRNLDESINIVTSDKPQLEVRSLSGDALEAVKYKISGDTLTLYDLQSDDIKPVRITVFVRPGGLQGMRVDSAAATVKGLTQEHLHITQENGGRIAISDSKIGNIRMQMSGGSDLNIYTTELDTVSASIEESQVFIAASFERLEGFMRNNSLLRVYDIGDVEFKKDESSTLTWYK